MEIKRTLKASGEVDTVDLKNAVFMIGLFFDWPKHQIEKCLVENREMETPLSKFELEG